MSHCSVLFFCFFFLILLLIRSYLTSPTLIFFSFLFLLFYLLFTSSVPQSILHFDIPLCLCHYSVLSTVLHPLLFPHVPSSFCSPLLSLFPSFFLFHFPLPYPKHFLFTALSCSYRSLGSIPGYLPMSVLTVRKFGYIMSKILYRCDMVFLGSGLFGKASGTIRLLLNEGKKKKTIHTQRTHVLLRLSK